MHYFFQNLLTASFHGSVIIAAVLLLRVVLNKAPKRTVCLLWMIAFIRLLMPFQLESRLSLQPEAIPLEEAPFYEAVFVDEPTDIPHMDEITTEPIVPAIPEDAGGESIGVGEVVVQPQPVPEEPTVIHWTQLLPYVWALGAMLMLLYAFGSYVHLKLTVREAVKVIGGWECDRIETAFILGYFRPRVYVPMGLTRRTRKHILSHEWAHLRSGDHWFKLLAYLALSLHWFNPLVWAAYRLMCKDMEHACDERVIRYMDLAERKQYSHALLTCSTNRSHYTPCPVAFGEVSVKSRILSVLNYRKPGFWITLVAIVAVVFVCVFLMTSPETAEVTNTDIGNTDEILHEADTDEVVSYTAPTYPDATEVYTVASIDDFLTALGSDRIIELTPGAFNLWEASTYTTHENTGKFYYWNTVYSSNELVIRNVENLIIRGSGRDYTEFVSENLNSDVLYFQNCSRIALEGFTAGHVSLPDSCAGAVIGLEACTDVTMDDLGLYGCGAIGIDAEKCNRMVVTNSDIYDCSGKAVDLVATNSTRFERCHFYRIGDRDPSKIGWSVLLMDCCKAVEFYDCTISDSHVYNLITEYSSEGIDLSQLIIKNNNIYTAALNFHNSTTPVTMERCVFTDNHIINWYSVEGVIAVDRSGAELTPALLEAEDGLPKPQYPARTEVRVSNVDELLAAIGPDTEIVLDAETYDLSKASSYGKTNGSYYFWQQALDGYELVIYKVNNMTIRSSDDNMKKHTIATTPRYANVMHFNMCSNITLSGFTAGHTEGQGDCGGGVIRLTGSKNVLVDNCGLFGCGTIGVDIWSSENVSVTDCDIYECSVGGVCVYETDTVTIQNTSFRDLGGYNNGYPGYVVAVMSSSNVTLDGKEVTDRINYSSGKLDASQIGITINGERTDIFEAEVGSFLRIEVAGVPEDTGITWSYDDPYVINGISQDGYYQVEVTGVGNCLVTALIGDVPMVVMIVGTAPEPSPTTKNDYCITYAGTPLVECSAAVGDTIALDTTNFPKDSAPVTIWSTDNRKNIRLEYTGDTSCEIKILETGEAIVSAYCGGEVAILKIYCRESW